MDSCSGSFGEENDDFFNGTSLSDIISYTLSYENDKKDNALKDAGNIPLLFHFLKHIWTSLTDSSLYSDLNCIPERDEIIPFMHSKETRELIASNILRFLEGFREEVSQESREDDYSTSTSLKNIAQGHLLTCFKVLSTFFMSSKKTYNELKNVSISLLGVLEIFMMLVPLAIDISTLLDFMTDFVKTLPTQMTKIFAEFIYTRSSFFKANFKELEKVANNTRLVQTSGAKLIGMIRAFEANLKEDTSTDVHDFIFNLRIMLTACLPISHLGICNRQSLSAVYKPITKASPDEWNKLETVVARNKFDGISDYEINVYESIASNAGRAKSLPHGQIFDVKFALWKDDGKITNITTDPLKIAAYSVYSDYCDLVNFMFQPEIIIEKTQEYVNDLQRKYESVLGHIDALLDRSNGSYDAKLTTIMEFNGNPFDFFSKCNNLSFWMSFLLSTCLALQTLKLSHKRAASADTTYSKLKEKCASTIDTIEKLVWKSIGKIKNFSELVTSILCRENEWVAWKRNGCSSDILEPYTGDALIKTLDGSEDISDFSEDEEEKEEGKYDEVTDFIDILEGLESLGYDPQEPDNKPEFGMDYTLEIDEIRLDRQSDQWYLQKKATGQAGTLTEKLVQKLEDYKEKLKMDEDPANDICESEKSKHDPLFRFRFGRLFANKHIEKYMDITNDEIASGSIEYLLKSIEK